MPQVFYLWRQHDPVEKGLEIIDVPHLAWLTDAFAVGESLQAEQLRRFVDFVIETEVY